MIIDELSNLGRYASLSPFFAAAVRYLSETPLDSLACGTVAIDGDRVFATLADNLTNPEERPFEMHDLYADIQVILRGSERFALGFDPQVFPAVPGKDLHPCMAKKQLAFDLDAGRFVIFFPGEAHAPGGACGDPCLCRKMVVKVLWPADKGV